MTNVSGNTPWEKLPARTTPINDVRLNAIETAINALMDAIEGLGLGDLANVNLTGLLDGNVPVWDETAGEWVPGEGGAGVALDDLTDVDLTTSAPTAGDVLTFDGTDWVPDEPATGMTAHVAAVTIPTGWTTSTGITVTGLVDTSAAMIGPVDSGSEWGADWVISTGTGTLTVTGTAPSAAVSAKLIWWT